MPTSFVSMEKVSKDVLFWDIDKPEIQAEIHNLCGVSEDNAAASIFAFLSHRP